jgi:hypothetical protein
MALLPRPGRHAVKERMTPYKAIIEGREREIVGWTHKGTLMLTDGELALTPLGGTLNGRVRRIARLKFENGIWWIDGTDFGTDLFKLPADDPAKYERAVRDLYAAKPDATPDDTYRVLAGMGEELAWHTHIETIGYLTTLLTGSTSLSESVKQNLRDHVVAVAWLEDHFRQDGIVQIPPRTPPTDSPRRLTKLAKQAEEIRKMVAELGVAPLAADESIPQPKRYLPIFLTRCDFIVSSQNPTTSKGSLPDWFTSDASAAKYARVSTRTIRNWKKRSWLHFEQDGRKTRYARTELDKCMKRQ